MEGTQMEFDNILGDKKKKSVGKKATVKSVKVPIPKETVSKLIEMTTTAQKPVYVANIGDQVFLAVAGESETLVHPCIVLKVNESGSVNVNVFHPGYMSYMEKIPFTGYNKVLGAVHWVKKTI